MAKKLIIDVGSTALRILQLTTADNNIVVCDAATVPYPEPLRPTNLSATVAAAVASARTSGRFRGRTATVGLAADLLWLRPVALPPVATEPARLRTIVDFEAQQQIPFPLNEVCWDYELLLHDDDSAEAIFAVVKREIVDELLQAMRQVRIRVERLSCAPLALYHLARSHGFGTERCDMVIDFGARSTIALILLDDRFFLRTIGIGGDAATHAIAQNRGLAYADAERLKRTHAHAAHADLCIGTDSELTAEVARGAGKVLDRLVGQLRRSISAWRSAKGAPAPTAIHLTGGGAQIPFIDDFLSTRLKLPAAAIKQWAPFADVTMPPGLSVDHRHATAAGLVVEATNPAAATIDLLPRTAQQDRRAAAALPYLAAAALLWLSLLAGALLLASQEAAVTKTAVATAHATAGKLEVAVAAATDFQIDAKLRQQQRRRLVELSARRQAMVGLWDAIERARPEAVQLTGTTPITQVEHPGHTSIFSPLTRAAPRGETIVGLRLQGRIEAAPGHPIFRESALARWPQATSDGLLPTAVGDERNLATTDPSRVANLFVAALESLPEFRESGTRVRSFRMTGDGQAAFSLSLALSNPLRDWEAK